MFIANHAEHSVMNTHFVNMMEIMTTSKHVHVIASEKMKVDLPDVWEDFSKKIKSTLNYDTPIHPELKQLSDTYTSLHKRL